MIQEDKMKCVSYCGIYCDLCGLRSRIPYQANILKESMVKDGFELWGKQLHGFEEFWQFLNALCNPDKVCHGCRQNGGPPFCSIRKCARKRKVDLCVFCKFYPCKWILEIAKGYPLLIPDGKRIKEIGIDTWIQEQKERVKTGFIYADIRCYPFTIPDE